jgi:hypothetical protein
MSAPVNTVISGEPSVSQLQTASRTFNIWKKDWGRSEWVRNLRNSRTKVRSGTATDEDIKFMKEYYDNTFRGDYSQTFVKAARMTWMFFDGNTSFNWSYASPPARYRPSGRGESISISYDLLPLSMQPRPEHYLGWDKDDPEDME